MSDTKYIFANWKTHITKPVEAVRLLRVVQKSLAESPQHVELVLCPPAIFLPLLADDQAHLAFGAQDVADIHGVRTGELTADMFREVGCTYALCGHAERRLQGETLEVTHRKILASIRAHLTPVICLGETAEDRAAGNSLSVVADQLAVLLAEVTHPQTTILCYQPLWATSSQQDATAADPETIRNTVLTIRATLAKRYTARVADRVPIIYGGSVKPSVMSTLFSIDGLQGVLIGQASTDPKKMQTLLQELPAVMHD